MTWSLCRDRAALAEREGGGGRWLWGPLRVPEPPAVRHFCENAVVCAPCLACLLGSIVRLTDPQASGLKSFPQTHRPFLKALLKGPGAAPSHAIPPSRIGTAEVRGTRASLTGIPCGS